MTPDKSVLHRDAVDTVLEGLIFFFMAVAAVAVILISADASFFAFLQYFFLLPFQPGN
jgi:hypothetical protein